MSPPFRAGFLFLKMPMKKVLPFLRSMRFGLILLGIIGICSVVGSVIPQGEAVAFYAKKYQELHGYILLLGLDDVFHGWFFITVSALLCLNLTFCSILRINNVVRAAKTERNRAAVMPDEKTLTAATRQNSAV